PALMNDTDQMALMVAGNEARMRFRTADDIPYMCELVMGLFARRSRELLGSAWSLRSVAFAHAPLGARPVYDRIFQATVSFGMPFNEVVFDRSLLELPLQDSDRNLHAILAAQVEEVIASLAPAPAPPSFVQAVEQALAVGLLEGDATLTRV